MYQGNIVASMAEKASLEDRTNNTMTGTIRTFNLGNVPKLDSWI